MPKYPYSVSVRARLLRLGRTQKELAARLGYSPSYISMVLSRKFHAPKLKAQIENQLAEWEAKS